MILQVSYLDMFCTFANKDRGIEKVTTTTRGSNMSKDNMLFVKTFPPDLYHQRQLTDKQQYNLYIKDTKGNMCPS